MENKQYELLIISVANHDGRLNRGGRLAGSFLPSRLTMGLSVEPWPQVSYKRGHYSNLVFSQSNCPICRSNKLNILSVQMVFSQSNCPICRSNKLNISVFTFSLENTPWLSWNHQIVVCSKSYNSTACKAKVVENLYKRIIIFCKRLSHSLDVDCYAS